MIQINGKGYETACLDALHRLYVPKYKIESDSKIAYETSADFSFDEISKAARIKNGKFMSDYDYDAVKTNGSEQMALEIDYYKKCFIDSHQIEKIVEELKENPSSKNALMVTPKGNDSTGRLPCEIYAFFRLLNKELFMNAHMRANNAYGLSLIDMHLNNAIAADVADKLDIEKVRYNHLVDAFHLYKRDLYDPKLLELLATKKIEIDDLIKAAQSAVGKFEVGNDCHNSAGSVATALLSSKTGAVYTGINLDMKCGMGSCAEQNAIIEMLKDRETQIDTLVNVHHNGEIRLPCGKCREFIAQLDKENLKTKIVMPSHEITTLERLLPY
jgi:cytidine deaminase